MKKIEAIIRPSKLKAVQRGLKEADIPCITAIPVKGSGLQKSYSERYRGTEQSLILQTRIMIICIISDLNLEKCIDVILENASENQLGMAKYSYMMFMMPLGSVQRYEVKMPLFRVQKS